MVKRYIICKGDTTTHGGVVLNGSDSWTIEGIPVAHVGHMVSCPQCQGTFPIAEGATRANIMGMNIALEGMKTTCGAVLISSQTQASVDDPGWQGIASVMLMATTPTQQPLSANDVPNNHFASLDYIPEDWDDHVVPCKYCHTAVYFGRTFCERPNFKQKIRHAIDKQKNINLVFAALCEYYLVHFDVWKSTFIKEMISDLNDIVGKSYDNLEEQDKPRFWALLDLQTETQFFGTSFGLSATGGPDKHFDKVQHCVSGMKLAADYSYSVGLLAGWFVEKIDTFKAVILDMFNKKESWHIGFDWYDYAFTVAGAALGHLFAHTDDQKAHYVLYKFASGEKQFDSFYQPPEFKDYKGMGKFDPLFPMNGNSADLLDKSIDEMLKNL